MMGMIWVVLLVALTGSHLGHCSPLRSTPQTYPHDANSQSQLESWGSQGGMYAAVPALALLITAVGLLLGCTWCYRHKDCKPNEGADNQLFTASATHLHDGRRAHPPDSGFVEPVNNNISEDNNNGPISLREMQNIANNNAAAYIVSENEERNRVSRESVVEFEPLPTGIRVADPLEHCADWFGEEDFPRNRLQYLREIGRGWFGRVVEGEVEDNGSTSTVAVKILNQNASLEDKARFLDEAKMYRDVRHENILAFITKCLQEDPWILIFELCSMDLQQYLIVNRPKMAILNESGVPLRLMCDVSSALAHLHSRGFLYGNVWCGSVQVRGACESARAVLGRYGPAAPPYRLPAPETRAQPPLYTAQSESWCLGTLIWEVCAWGASPDRLPPPLPDLPCPYRNHLYQVMQLCWSEQASSRPTAAQVQALVLHLYCSTRDLPEPRDDGYGSSDFEERWQRLKPNSIPKHDEHRAIVHTHDDLSVDMDTAVSRSSSIMSDKDMSVQIKSESLTNLHGSLEDVRNIYLTHNETATLECHQGNISLEDAREKEQDRSDASMDPWLKDIIAGSTDDVSYYKDVSDVIKNLDNILNSEKTSSSESSHQASPSRDNLSLDCKKDYPMQSSMVKSPGITNFQNILDTGFSSKSDETETGDDDELDRDTIGTLSHSFERHSELDTTSQHTLENLTPDTPIKDIDVVRRIEIQVEVERVDTNNILVHNEPVESVHQHTELPNDNKIVSSDSEIPKLKELCVASIPSASDIEQLNVKDCQTSCDSNLKEISTDIKNETKSIDDVGKIEDTPREVESKDSLDKIELEQMVDDIFLPIMVHGKTTSKVEQSSQDESTEEKLEEKLAKHEDSDNEKVLDSDLIKVTDSSEAFGNSKEDSLGEVSDLEPSELLSPEQTPESVQSMSNIENSNLNETKETEIPVILIEEVKSPTPDLPPEIVQSIFKDENDTESATVRDEIEDAMKEDDGPVIRIQEVQQQNAIIKEEINTSVEQVFKETDDSTNNRNIYEEISSEPIIDPNIYFSYVTKAATNVVKDVSDFLLEERKIAMLHEIKPKLATEDSQSPTDVTEHNQESTLCAVHKSEDVLAQVGTNEVEKLEDENKESLLDELKDANIIEDANVSKIVPLVLDKASPIIVDSKENILGTVENFELDKSPQKIQLDEFTINEEIAKVIVENVSKDIPLVQDVEKNDVVINKMEMRDDKISKTVFEEAPGPKVEHTIHGDEPTADNHEETVISVIANVSIESTLKEDDTEQVPDEILGAIIEPISSTHVENVNAELKDDKVPIAAVLQEKVEDNSDGDKIRSDNNTLADTRIHSDNSTVYMDLINDTNNGILSDNTLDSHVRNVIKSCLDNSSSDNTCTLVKNESTEYLDPPSFGIKDIDNFLHMEKVFNSQNSEVVSSTPLASDGSAEINSTIENSIKEELSETKVPDLGMGVSVTKLEQRYVPDSMSPFESPTKSHHTDTYDENSSVVLGPFENCTLELFKGAKPAELVDLPKEELLAFSSNFSEMNLETPSPLRDGNFLNEVPDIVHDDLQFDDVQSLSEKQSDPQTETPSAPSGNSGTEKRVSPLTPPNSPGVFLASTSQQKYIVDIDLTPEPAHLQEPDLSLQKEIELNQIELQITSKLAMAENENNMNIEYSGPLTVEGLVSDDEMLLRESDALPESYLAGNGGYVEDMREDLTLDEECVKALRNELELKLPLAQVAAIEPPCEQEWSAELPPPPELIVSYPGALSPIAEETGQQLSAYENDMNWNLSTRTESSESYPEPCNNSTDDVTELPTGAQTYTIQSRDPSRNPSRDQSQNNTYTLHRDLDLASSREITMSADSLNASPFKKLMPDSDADSPIDDKTYTKEEEKESLERISQVSPFLLSPTTDTSAPENSDNLDNATGVSTLSKTTLPTDAKLSKPSETQCLSKATSIDSWCSNDTLYNVEENFDDLAMDPDVPDFEPERDEHSESTDTLTHNDDEKEVSHCSTYIIHDSKSEACETFSPDSITANDNYTYTKVKTDNAGTTPSVLTKSDLNDSTKNTTKDLAYGTLMSGMPSYSNCTTEVVSGFDDWKVAQPELVRRSPMPEDNDITPPNPVEDKEADVTSPQLATEPSLKKLESVEISCLQDDLIDSRDKTNQSDSDALLIHTNSPNYNYKSMAPSVTSTPLTDLLDDAENVEGIPMHLPTGSRESSEDSVHVPNFQAFIQSVEVRPQDLSSNVSNEGINQDTEILLDGESKTLSRNSNRDSLAVSERTPTYSDFENSALSKPQDVNSKDKSSQSMESGISSEDFQKFETSVRSRPQDLSSLIDASSLLLKSERMSSELAMGSLPTDLDQTSQSGSRDIANEPQSHTSPPIVTNFNESHSLINFREPNFLINFDTDDETEQPHSIIITETTMDAFRESPSKNYDSNDVNILDDVNHAYEPHTSRCQAQEDFEKLLEHKINGELDFKEDNLINCENLSPKVEAVSEKTDTTNSIFVTEIHSAPHTSRANDKSRTVNEVDCNGGSEKFATVNFLNETFEELIESNVDDETKDPKTEEPPSEGNASESLISSDSPLLKDLESPKGSKSIKDELQEIGELTNGVTEENGRMTVVTEDFLQNEKNFCQLDSYFPLLSDIRFTGPATEIMSTSFTQDSPTEPASPECPEKRDTAAELLKEWDSDSDSHTSNSSSGEFIWKQRTGESRNNSGGERHGSPPGGSAGSGPSDGSADSGSGSEGDEVEFVPSSWDCRAAPSKSSLRSLEQATPDNKKRVVFKRQKYHCVYEYPREVADIEAHSPASYLPDLSTYSEWDPTSAEEAELGYGQLFGAPSPLDLYPLRAGIAFGADYDEDFFISSSARPFESLGIMSTTSQFFPGKHVKPSLLERDLSDDLTEDFPPPPSPLPTTTLMQTRTPSLDFTTPDSGVEDITPGSTTDDDFKKKLPETELTWRPVDSASSSESVSPSSPGGEALGGLRHTRDKLKLDLPPSPHIPSPRHNRVFNFVLDKPKRREDRPADLGTTPLVMTDDTPIVTTSLPLQKDCEDLPVPEPTFSTFGKSPPKVEPEQKLILTDEVEESTEVKVESPKVVEAVKGEGTVLDSGDEDSGIESSSKATLERNKTNVS